MKLLVITIAYVAFGSWLTVYMRTQLDRDRMVAYIRDAFRTDDAAAGRFYDRAFPPLICLFWPYVVGCYGYEAIVRLARWGRQPRP